MVNNGSFSSAPADKKGLKCWHFWKQRISQKQWKVKKGSLETEEGAGKSYFNDCLKQTTQKLAGPKCQNQSAKMIFLL